MVEEVNHSTVMKNEKLGRYLVADKYLEGGELIFTDAPFTVGPKPDSPPLCLSCYCPVVNVVCSRCYWPICSEACESSPQHAGECNVFSSVKVRFQPVKDWTASAPQLDCITPLRLLLAKEENPDRWQRELLPMETHKEARQLRPTWSVDQNNIVNFLVDHCKLGNRFSKELVQHVCGILEVNAVEIPSRGGFSIRAIYPLLSIAAHSCVPNIVHTILQNDFRVEIRAAVSIECGETLHLCYTHVLAQTISRREYLRESKFFDCDCPRCADPTELGTHLSTILCTKCGKGKVLSTNPLDNDAEWKCNENKCHFTQQGKSVRMMLAAFQEEIDQLDALESGQQAIVQREATLHKYKATFHPCHSLLLSMKYTLAQLYGRVGGYRIHELPRETLKQKAKFCRLVLDTLKVIAPGDTRMRGMMLYELHAPLTCLARNDFTVGLITRDKLNERLEEPLQCLKEAARILLREDANSPEGIMGQIARQSVRQLEASVNCL